jgi:hypothetical protein
MKNYLTILSVMLSFLIFQNANAEWKFGISVGQSDIDYDIQRSYADAGDSFEDAEGIDTYFNAIEYNATELIFDFRNGPHAIAYKITDGSADGWDESYKVNGELKDITDAAATYSSDANREEWTLSYAYSFGNNWTLSAGLYSGSLEYSYVGTWLSPADEGTYYEDLWSGAETGGREWKSEGAFIAAGYSNKISEKVFWFAKFGFQASDAENLHNYDWSNTYSAVNDDWYQSGIEYYQANYGVVNGTYNISRNTIREAEGEATVFGLGLVYAINPKNSIILEFETKSYSMDPGEMTTHNCTGLAYICDQAELSTKANTMEEDASYITLRYRYAF